MKKKEFADNYGYLRTEETWHLKEIKGDISWN